MQNKHFIWGVSGLIFGIALGVLIANAGLVAMVPSAPEGSDGIAFVNPDIAANPVFDDWRADVLGATVVSIDERRLVVQNKDGAEATVNLVSTTLFKQWPENDREIEEVVPKEIVRADVKPGDNVSISVIIVDGEAEAQLVTLVPASIAEREPGSN